MVDMSWSTRELLLRGFPDPEPEFELPDLAEPAAQDLLALSVEAFTNRLGPDRQRYFETWMNMARLAGKALRGYQSARTYLADYRRDAHEGGVTPYYRAVDGIEDAISATHRGFLVARRLTAITGRALPQPTDRQAALLNMARDYVEGADEWLIEKRMPAGELFVVAPRATYIVIASIRLPYKDLAWCITKLHRAVAQIGAVPD